MLTKGKFILFDTTEFANWLNNIAITRIIRLIQIHHTWLPDYSTFRDNHFALLESMEASHKERGFSEIGQNLTIFPDGKVAICRNLNTIPAGIKGANTYGICIEGVGNFDIGKDQMTQAHRDAYCKVVALLCIKFNLTPDTNSIVYHHWYDLNTGLRTDGTGSTKTCPGTNFFGGNSVQACRDNFIPQIVAALADPAINDAINTTWPIYGEVNVQLLNVRSAPSTSAAITRQISYGTDVNIYELQNSWYRINQGEWVYKDYITIFVQAAG
jgi:hypothetical protein